MAQPSMSPPIPPTQASKLSSARTLGGVGSILAILSFLPYVGIVLAIVGFVMVLIAVNYIANHFQDRSIFNNYLISVIVAIVGIVVGVLVVFATVFKFLGLGYMAGPDFVPVNVTSGDVVALILGIIGGLLVMWVCAIVAAIFLKMSYDKITNRLGVGLFHTAALLNLIGAITAVILIGFVIIFIAQILFIGAFFSIPEQRPM